MITLLAAVFSGLLMRLEQGFALAREHDDGRRSATDRHPGPLNESLVGEPLQVAAPDVS